MDDAETQRVLKAYATGAISRGTAMEFLGLDWYGDLLVLLNRHGVGRPCTSAANRRVMEESLRLVLGQQPQADLE
jgi:hypothetical protein